VAHKILLVDDDEPIRDFLAEVLKNARYEVRTASDGHEALEQLESEEPDLLVTDLLMPRMDGYELCVEVRKASSVPIVAITGSGGPTDMERAFRSGADAFLPKPFDISELKTQIETLIAQHRARSSPSGPESIVVSE
jgi:OmpR family response regulator RpaB